MIYLFGGTSSIYQKSPFLDANNESHLSYNGEYFPTKETILVSVNFRQDLFATLYLEGEFGGNLAGFDQNLAIRWVKKHIMRFCGDDENLTLFGNSLGAMATGVHLISDYSKNLISNAILQSSSPLFHDIFPATRDEIILSSFATINEFKCVNLSRRLDYSSDKMLNKEIKKEFFDQKTLKINNFWSKLEANLKKLKSRLANEKEANDELDANLIRLIRFLSKYTVDVACLQSLPEKAIADKANPFPSPFYFDFDFIGTEAYLNYQLFNRLSLNPKVNILNGVVSDETCFEGIVLKELYYADQTNPPAVSKQDAWKLIQSTGFLRTSEFKFTVFGRLSILILFFSQKNRKQKTLPDHGRFLYGRSEVGLVQRLLRITYKPDLRLAVCLSIAFLRQFCGLHGQFGFRLCDHAAFVPTLV